LIPDSSEDMFYFDSISASGGDQEKKNQLRSVTGVLVRLQELLPAPARHLRLRMTGMDWTGLIAAIAAAVGSFGS
jgi:hypothetical protein